MVEAVRGGQTILMVASKENSEVFNVEGEFGETVEKDSYVQGQSWEGSYHSQGS